MHRTALVLATAVASLVLAGCGGADGEAGGSATDSPSTAVVESPSPTQGAPAPEGSETGDPDAVVTASPDAGQTADLTTRLTAISPALTDDPDAVLANALAVCTDVVQGQNATTLADNAAARWTDGGDEPLTDDQAAAVVQAVRDAFCHG